MYLISHQDTVRQDMGMSVFKRLVLAVVTLTLATESQAADFYLEAANSRGHPRTVNRANARTGVAVRLEAGESIQLTFCLRQTTVIQVGVCLSVYILLRRLSITITY